MGSLLQLLQTVGRTEYKMFHILVISCLAVTALAEPGYYTQNYWPTRVGPYSYSTCYGCYGKRSADAEPVSQVLWLWTRTQVLWIRTWSEVLWLWYRWHQYRSWTPHHWCCL